MPVAGALSAGSRVRLNAKTACLKNFRHADVVGVAGTQELFRTDTSAGRLRAFPGGGCGIGALPERARDLTVLRGDLVDGKFPLVETERLTQVLDHCRQRDDQVGERVAAHGPVVGVRDVFVLAALEVAVD